MAPNKTTLLDGFCVHFEPHQGIDALLDWVERFIWMLHQITEIGKYEW
jgi:hypothetical protein